MSKFVQVSFDDRFNHDDLIVIKKRVCVGIKVEYVSIDENLVNYTTNQNVTTIKYVRKSKKGLYHDYKLNRGYGSKNERQYLTEEELKELEEYLKGYESL